MTNATATLLAPKKDRVTREDLALMPTMISQGPRHHPRSHLAVIEGVESALDHHGLEIISESLAVSGSNEAKLLGTFRVRPSSLDHSAASALRSDAEWSLAVRSSQDRSWGLGLCAGLHILACSNGILSGSDGAILKARHCHDTPTLWRKLRDAVEIYIAQQVALVEITDRAKEREITDQQVKALIVDTFCDKTVNISPRLFREVVSNYFSPDPAWTDITTFRGTTWALHNSFSRALRSSSPSVRYRVTRALAPLLNPSRS